jgi:Tfp pilus assembly protein PilV
MQRSKSRRQRTADRGQLAFALYEVLLGLAIFAIGVLALGRAVQNCLNASTLSAEENRVRQILANRMAEVQTTPGAPDPSKEFNVDTGYGMVKLIQKSAPADLEDDNGGTLSGINRVTLTVQWARPGSQEIQTIHHVERSDNVMAQWIRDRNVGNARSITIEFYVYRPG